MIMIYIIILVFFLRILYLTTIKNKLEQNNKILTNNYLTALKVLAKYDPKLSAYLQANGKIVFKNDTGRKS